MSEMHLPNLGGAPTDGARRDCVHVAVAPVVAGDQLAPGQRVAIINGKFAVGIGDPIGIVDPFLEQSVRAGEPCWVLLFPNTITSLRHVWSHPSFVAKPADVGGRA